ncbi:MAG: hypothetical protein NTX03_04425 [Bacteroidetes bacterium]|nr:hypothetical protein [Bacteroidota bacterium]
MKILDFRKVENLHIFLWLIKDTCWAAHWVIPGMVMILPTISAAIWLLVRNRTTTSEIVHNAAVLLWITANATWMTGEFFKIETTLKPIALVFFAAGLSTLSVYYIYHFLKTKKENE